MLTRHEGEVTSFLRMVNDIGCGNVRTSVLKGWFGLDNLSKTIWREIHERWTEISACELLLVAEAKGSYTFVFGDGLTPPNTSDKSKDWWLEDIRTWQ